jgi:hypothetical protein
MNGTSSPDARVPQNDEPVALRSPSTVMNPERAAAVVPNALSFARAAMRELVRGRYRVEKLRFDLDRDGRGEVLYRLIGGGWTFHFFLVSQKLPEEQKTDRNFAQSWDAMGVLCQGEWTPEREARLRLEVPKQRAGFADYDTLVYARGNRSARLFDHVVESLASGRQPDLTLIAPIGYILRTTAFIGNGQLGTRAWAGLERGHPLRRPYHVQFCSAFVLREFVFDLVDHMARARNPDAARLAPAYRRYLGLGNAAATGLVPFVVNHPHLMHQWCLAYETALARARHRRAAPGDDVVSRFEGLLDKAIRYFTESERPSDGVFATPQTVASELRRARQAFAALRLTGTLDGRDAPLPWVALHDWAERHLHREALETLDAIVLELYPDIVDAAVDDFDADERFEVQPGMPIAELRRIVHGDYAWALAAPYRDHPPHHFWYRTTKAPRDVRRGLRGRAEALEAETAMDTVLQVQRLSACLEQAAANAAVADIVCARPDLRHIVARVQSLAGLPYAELREDWLSSRFSPFRSVRFVLAFFGLEKFEAAMPKSVRGTFMQGAPIAEDVAAGVDGDWPFPVMPSDTSGADLLAPLPVSSPDSNVLPAGAAAESEQRVIAPCELARMAQTALQGHGAALGVAEDAGKLVMFAQACGQRAVAALLRQCGQGGAARGAHVALVQRDAQHAVLDAHGGSALLAAPVASDLACALAHASPRGVGSVGVTRASDAWMVAALALRCAEHGMIGVVAWNAGSSSVPPGGFAIAGPGSSGCWYAHASSGTLSELPDGTIEGLAGMVGAAQPADDGLVIVCLRPRSDAAAERIFAGVARSRCVDTAWNAGELRDRRERWLQRGVALTRAEHDALNAAGATLYVTPADEPRVLNDGVDPLKVF